MATPYCKHCGYPLTALADPRCPECGQSFDLRNISTFENRYPRDGHDRVADFLVIIAIAVTVICVVTAWLVFRSDPGR